MLNLLSEALDIYVVGAYHCKECGNRFEYPVLVPVVSDKGNCTYQSTCPKCQNVCQANK